MVTTFQQQQQWKFSNYLFLIDFSLFELFHLWNLPWRNRFFCSRHVIFDIMFLAHKFYFNTWLQKSERERAYTVQHNKSNEHLIENKFHLKYFKLNNHRNEMQSIRHLRLRVCCCCCCIGGGVWLFVCWILFAFPINKAVPIKCWEAQRD